MENTFNPIKTIKLINKESLLTKVYESNLDSFNVNVLITKAEKEDLSETEFNTLKQIFETVIIKKKAYLDEFNKIKDKRVTNRRYGKVQIIEDIKNQNNIPTEVQLTMLSLAELKRDCATLQGRGVSDHYKGTSKISLSDHKKIRSAIRTLQVQLDSILK